LTNSFEILSRRWPEVLLIIVFSVGTIFLTFIQYDIVFSDAQTPELAMSSGKALVIALGGTGFAVITLLLTVGFFYTAYISGAKEHQPADLIRAGRPYFWRFFRFQLLFKGMAVMLIGVAVLTVMVPGSGGPDKAAVPAYAQAMASFVSMMVLLKVFILLPAIMLVFDKMVLPAFQSIFEFAVFKDRSLTVFFVASAVFESLMAYFAVTLRNQGFMNYLAVGICAAITSGLALVAGLKAMELVSAGVVVAEEVSDDELEERE
jgi:hypothetical protein